MRTRGFHCGGAAYTNPPVQPVAQDFPVFIGAHQRPVPGRGPGTGLLIRERRSVKEDGLDPDAACLHGFRLQQPGQDLAKLLRCGRAGQPHPRRMKPVDSFHPPPRHRDRARRRAEDEPEPEAGGKLDLPAEYLPFGFGDRRA